MDSGEASAASKVVAPGETPCGASADCAAAEIGFCASGAERFEGGIVVEQEVHAFVGLD